MVRGLPPYFSKASWQGKYSIWQAYDAFRSLGLPDLAAKVRPPIEHVHFFMIIIFFQNGKVI
jgi:hypothetical protein